VCEEKLQDPLFFLPYSFPLLTEKNLFYIRNLTCRNSSCSGSLYSYA